MGPSIKGGNNVARKGRPQKKQTGWCSYDETGRGRQSRDKTLKIKI
jgi:hypothetical protein